MTETTEDDAKTEVFDVANWLDRATGSRPAVDTDYQPKHRAEGPAA
jgi:hypothetical protein